LYSPDGRATQFNDAAHQPALEAGIYQIARDELTAAAGDHMDRLLTTSR
jgi:hypothetical protein